MVDVQLSGDDKENNNGSGKETSLDVEGNGVSDDDGNYLAASEETSTQPQRRFQWSVSCLLWRVGFPLMIVLVTIWGIGIALGDGGWIPFAKSNDSTVRFENDPFRGLNSDRQFSWFPNGTEPKNGLRLEILNALDDSYQDLFQKVLQDWDNGSPDSLTLTVTRVSVDSRCRHVRNKLKLCNGDYGETNWNGQAALGVSKDNVISAAVAYLNDFYLSGASEVLRRYTLCHEMGHGFGLPHTDEDYSNPNLGNCMDYTNDPSSNTRPDQSNFLYLANLYGSTEN